MNDITEIILTFISIPVSIVIVVGICIFIYKKFIGVNKMHLLLLLNDGGALWLNPKRVKTDPNMIRFSFGGADKDLAIHPSLCRSLRNKSNEPLFMAFENYAGCINPIPKSRVVKIIYDNLGVMLEKSKNKYLEHLTTKYNDKVSVSEEGMKALPNYQNYLYLDPDGLNSYNTTDFVKDVLKKEPNILGSLLENKNLLIIIAGIVGTIVLIAAMQGWIKI